MDQVQIIKEIIKEQSLIIGEQLAMSRAEASGVVKFTSDKLEDFTVISDSNSVVQDVIKSFEELFGAASTQVCNKVLKRMEGRE